LTGKLISTRFRICKDFSIALDRPTFEQEKNVPFDPSLGLLAFGGIAPVPVLETEVTVPIQGYAGKSANIFVPSNGTLRSEGFKPRAASPDLAGRVWLVDSVAAAQAVTPCHNSTFVRSCERKDLFHPGQYGQIYKEVLCTI
jgi:hypothetical protein